LQGQSTKSLEACIGVGLQALSESLPKYSEKDLLVVHGMTEKGMRKDEVWTRKDFEPLELQLGLDGREQDSDEHHGSFYGMVTRTSDISEANMTVVHLTIEHHMKASLPDPKRRKVSSAPLESSTLPILVNKKAIKKHTKLLVFQEDKNLEAKKDKKEEKVVKTD
jgi:hypothetical protein